MGRFSAATILFAATLAAGLERSAAAEVPATVDFSHDIVPILRQHCAECHTGDKKKGSLSFNTRETTMKGGENGPVIKPGQASASLLMKVVLSTDTDDQMPPKGPRLTPEETGKLRAWIDGGAVWTEGFAFKKPAYEPPLHLHAPVLPVAQHGRTNLIDRILDARTNAPSLKPLDDAAFARRVHLDLTGLLPTTDQLSSFLGDRHKDKRARLVNRLLTNDVAYAEHWLSFWNDLLRNDYAGTGYIDGGRKQISAWLYQALLENKPYDQFARELIAPSSASEGFSKGIQWRGAVSAGQSIPVQFAQSVGQTFLGINLKCASCHDSFIDRWTLKDSYGLAAIYSDKPLELHRCDKPTGKFATPAWLFPETGKIDADKPQAERLQQLAQFLTDPGNGRFPRTIVNRLWHRLMGHGIVHPTDAMQTEPWSPDLLDALAAHLADNHYNLKATLALICNSAAYQSRAEVRQAGQDDHGYHYAGPRAKRLSAEEFVDAIWQITSIAPERYDAPVLRAHKDPSIMPRAEWIWADGAGMPPGGDAVTFRRTLVLGQAPATAGAAVTADNSYTLYVNGKKVKSGDNWESVQYIDLAPNLKAGTNEFVIFAKNGGTDPNPAGLYFEARWRFKDGPSGSLGTGPAWTFVRATPDDHGVVKDAGLWKPAVTEDGAAWRDKTSDGISTALLRASLINPPMIRAALVKSDPLQRTLGRPNREQIVSVRPDDLSTLEAMDLSNGPVLAGMLAEGAKKLAARPWKSPEALAEWLYRAALSRPPGKAELQLARATLGAKLTPEGVEDLLWSVIMLPEFQMVR